MGESFGSCVTLAVAAQCKRVNRVVIINPATSFSRTVWPTGAPLLTEIPEPVYPLVTLLLAPVLGMSAGNRFASNLYSGKSRASHGFRDAVCVVGIFGPLCFAC